MTKPQQPSDIRDVLGVTVTIGDTVLYGQKSALVFGKVIRIGETAKSRLTIDPTVPKFRYQRHYQSSRYDIREAKNVQVLDERTTTFLILAKS